MEFKWNYSVKAKRYLASKLAKRYSVCDYQFVITVFYGDSAQNSPPLCQPHAAVVGRFPLLLVGRGRGGGRERSEQTKDSFAVALFLTLLFSVAR